MKKIILFLSFNLLLIGCATRNKVHSNKTTSPRWISVDNPEEFMSKKELEFLNMKK